MVETHLQRAGRETHLAALADLAARPFASLDEAIEAALSLISDLFEVRLAMVHRLDGENLVITHACDRLGLGVVPPIVVPCKDTFCDDVLASVAPLLVPDADADPRFHDRLGKKLVGTRTYIGVPILLSDGRLYGTLCAHDRRILDLGAREIETLRVLARQLASQIERDEAAKIEAESARRLARRNVELGAALRRLDVLREVVESISSELDLQPLLERIVASAVRLLGAHGGAISLLGENLDAPRRLTATFNVPDDLRAESIPARAGLMGQVIAARGPIIVARYEDLHVPLTNRVFYDLAPWIAVPIWWQGEIVGTFGIGAKDPSRTFGERDAELLTLLAKHAAIAIENARLYAASRHLGAAEERNRLAGEIHDTLAQSLLALTVQLRAARGLIASAPERAAAELSEAEARARAALEEARRSVWNLGPAALEAGTLVEALHGEVAGSGRSGLPGKLTMTGTARPLAAETQLVLLRIAQEALANARKHARAARVELALDYGPGAVTLTVTDDGAGFVSALAARRGPTPTGGFGLAGMEDRLRGVGGHLAIDTAPGQGTRILATAPYDCTPRLAVDVAPAATTQIRVVIADDHPATRAGLAALLAEQPDIVVVAEAADGEEALRQVEQLQPDVLLVDLRMPKLGGVETIGRLTQLGTPTRAIAVTTFAQDELVHDALRAGARGYLLKDIEARDLAAAVRTVSAGGTLLAPSVAGMLAARLAAPSRLTARERQVLALLGRGLADKEIATALGTSVKTASFHVANVLSKLGAHNRADAVRLAYARGLLTE